MNRVTCFWLLALLNLTTPAALSAAPLGVPAADGVPVARKLATPAGLTVESGDGQVTLSWRPSEGATSYTVFRRAADTGDTVRLATGVTALTYVDKGVTNGTVYRYWVRASNGPVTSAPSTEAAARPELPRTVDAMAPASALTFTSAPSAPAPASATASPAAAGEAGARVTEQTSGASSAPAIPGATVKAAAPASQQAAVAASAVMISIPVGAPAAAAPVSVPVAVQTAATALTALTALTTTVPSTVVAPAAPTTSVASAPVSAANAPQAMATPPATIASSMTVAPAPAGLASTTVSSSSAVSTTSLSTQTTPTAVDSVTTAVAPSQPRNLTSTAGNGTITLTWTAVTGATSYNIYRSLVSNAEVVIASAFTNTFPDSGLANGTTYYYKVTAVSAGGESVRSSEVNNSPIGPPAPPDPATVAAFRLLRQGSWGAKPGEVDAARNQGAAAWIATQLAMQPSTYPDTLFNMSVEDVQEHFMANALTGQDQLRQRVALALHKIWVVSAVEITNAQAIVTYHRMLLNGAFGNYRDLMRDITLNPAMGRYLNMLNNRSQAVDRLAAERELRARADAALHDRHREAQSGRHAGDRLVRRPCPELHREGREGDWRRRLHGLDLRRRQPDDDAERSGRRELRACRWKRVARYHDTNAKIVPRTGRSRPARPRARIFDQALDVIFSHPNVRAVRSAAS